MRLSVMGNTQRKILERTNRSFSVSARRIVECLYPKSKQPEKKLVTITTHLRKLRQSGLVYEVGGVWIITRAGITCLAAHDDGKRPTMLRLAR